MTTFHLTVVTPDGCAFDGQAERVVCRAIDGDLAILAKHGDYCTALGMGEAHIVDADGQRRRAACMGGMLTVLNGDVHLVATTWEWAEEIDQATPRPPRSAPKRFWPGRTWMSANMSWPRPASSAPSSAPLSTDPGALDKSAPLWYTGIRKIKSTKAPLECCKQGPP